MLWPLQALLTGAPFWKTAPVDPDKLARALADRFQRIVPAGYYVREENGVIWYAADAPLHGHDSNASYFTETFDSYGQTAVERIAGSAEHAMNELQDFVDESSTEPWPGKRTVPRAHAAVRHGMLHIWFGDADAPELECEPIELASLE